MKLVKVGKLYIKKKRLNKQKKDITMNLKKWAYIKHFEELEIKTLTKRKRSITNLNNSNEELKRIRKELKRLKKGVNNELQT